MSQAVASYDLPLAPPQLAELAAALGDRSLHAALGFLAGIVSVPKLIPGGVWITELLGNAELKDEAHAERVASYVMQLQAYVGAQLLADEVEAILPPDDDIVARREWCDGYVDVLDQVEVDGETEEVLVDLFAVEFLAGRITDGEINEVLEPGATIESYASSVREDLPEIISSLYAAWEPGRRRGATVKRDATKVGRNDPCPCGSDKKFKKCCGAALN